MTSAIIKLNNEDGSLPYGLFFPSDQNLTWNCNYGFPEMLGGEEVIPIISVFTGREEGEKKEIVQVLPDLNEAKRFRDELLAHGWKKLSPPKIFIKHEDGTETPADKKFIKKLAKSGV